MARRPETDTSPVSAVGEVDPLDALDIERVYDMAPSMPSRHEEHTQEGPTPAKGARIGDKRKIHTLRPLVSNPNPGPTTRQKERNRQLDAIERGVIHITDYLKDNLEPKVTGLRKSVDDLKATMDTLIHTIHTFEGRLGVAETRIYGLQEQKRDKSLQVLPTTSTAHTETPHMPDAPSPGGPSLKMRSF